MNTWTALREALVLIESAEYRGQSGLRFDDLVKLVGAIIDPDKAMERATREAKARALLKPTGGAMDCNFRFSRKIWTNWQAKMNNALKFSGTDTAKVTQYPGEPRGGTVMKRNYGGRVVYQPGQRDQSHEMQGSAMDTYDVLMRADGWTLTRFAYAPSQGSYEERTARLEDLMTGREALALKRRPQPERPEPKPGMSANPKAQPVPRIGQNLRPSDSESGEGQVGSGGGSNSSFSSKLAQHDREYVPGRRRRDDDGDEEPLFPPKKKGK